MVLERTPHQIGAFGNRVLATFGALLVEPERGCLLMPHHADHVAQESKCGSFGV